MRHEKYNIMWGSKRGGDDGGRGTLWPSWWAVFFSSAQPKYGDSPRDTSGLLSRGIL